MKLKITLEQDFNDEDTLIANRDTVRIKAEQAGYLFHWTVSE